MTAGETERLAVELDQPLWQAAAHLEQAIAAGLQGGFTAAKDRIRMTLATDVLRGMRLHHAMALYGLGVAALGVGQYQEAYGLLRRVIDPADESSHYSARQWVVADLAEAAIGAGKLDDCADVLAGLREEFAGYPVPAVRHAVAFAAALLAPADRKPPHRKPGRGSPLPSPLTPAEASSPAPGSGSHTGRGCAGNGRRGTRARCCGRPTRHSPTSG